jgi:hypothetical protein
MSKNYAVNFYNSAKTKEEGDLEGRKQTGFNSLVDRNLSPDNWGLPGIHEHRHKGANHMCPEIKLWTDKEGGEDSLIYQPPEEITLNRSEDDKKNKIIEKLMIASGLAH